MLHGDPYRCTEIDGVGEVGSGALVEESLDSAVVRVLATVIIEDLAKVEIDILFDVPSDILFDVLFDVLFGILNGVNMNVSGAMLAGALELTLIVSFEESLLSSCAPCSCWPTTISGCDHALQASTPSDHL